MQKSNARTFLVLLAVIVLLILGVIIGGLTLTRSSKYSRIKAEMSYGIVFRGSTTGLNSSEYYSMGVDVAKLLDDLKREQIPLDEAGLPGKT